MDKIIEELKDELEETEKQKAIMRNIIALRDKEIKKLKAFGKIDKQRIEENLAEIKRLNKLTDKMLSTIVEFGIKQTEANQKALEEIDE